MAALQVKDIHKFNKKTAAVLTFSLDDKNIFVNQAALVVFVVATGAVLFWLGNGSADRASLAPPRGTMVQAIVCT